ncbi:MAG: TonB-dependent receptor plug domain-containing protein, partial [Phocaeicola sp.]
MKKLILFMLLLLPSLAWAQSSEIVGTVIDNTKEPIVGATILEVGSGSNGTITDIDGKFTLTVDQNSRIKISSIGYDDVIVSVAGKKTFAIILKEKSELLDEVIITGYGGKQNRGTVTSAVSKVDSKLLANRMVSNPAAALAGSAPGVVVQQTTGRPGATPNIIIRGGTNFDGSGSPLVVVDGLIRSMDEINPEDIQSIEIMKDASATSIYGARASNGVILITTKRGKAGHSSINLSVKLGMNFLRNTNDFADAEGYLYWLRTGFSNTIKRFGGTGRFDLANVGYGAGNLYYDQNSDGSLKLDANGNKVVLNPRADNRAL